jgi:DNA repair exonuclease SbcCD nuclease subunit
MSKPIAVCVADIHLSHTAPIARSEEPNWYDAMERTLNQLREIASKLKVPIICAGDIFHKWQAPPELINFAIRNLPEMYSVAGNHDLPSHNYEAIERSAYWTLVEAGIVHNLAPGKPCATGNRNSLNLVAHGFPCGVALGNGGLRRSKTQDVRLYHLAVVHHYAWRKGHTYPGADPESHVDALREKLAEFDAVVFGDNHKGFYDDSASPYIVNCGGLIRRNSDEADYQPQVWLLYSDGYFEPNYLDVSEDKISRTAEVIEAEKLNASEFISILRESGVHDLDYKQCVKQYVTKKVNNVSKATKEFILHLLEK